MSKTTARELIKLAATEESYPGQFTNLTYLGGYYGHVPEVDEYCIDTNKVNTRLRVRPIGDKDYDGRRMWNLSVVELDDIPVMLTQNGGREGDDHEARFILNPVLYRTMVGYLMSLYEVTSASDTENIGMDDERGDLDVFYGDSLDHVRRHPNGGYCC